MSVPTLALSLKNDATLLSDVIAFLSGEEETCPLTPLSWSPALVTEYERVAADKNMLYAFLSENRLLPKRTAKKETPAPEEEEITDAPAPVSGGFSQLDYKYSNFDAKTQTLMSNIDKLQCSGNELKEMLATLVPVYAVYGGSVPPKPRQMTPEQLSVYVVEDIVEETEIGPFYLAHLLETEVFPGQIQCAAGAAAVATIAGVTVHIKDSDIGTTPDERADLAAALASCSDKSKKIKYLSCDGLGNAHSILMNTFEIKREGEGFTVRERTILKGSEAYKQVRTVPNYRDLFIKVRELGQLTKDMWVFYNMVQVYLFKHRTTTAKGLFEHVPIAKAASTAAGIQKLSTMTDLMSRGSNLSGLGEMHTQMKTSKSSGRNLGSNKELFRSNASFYGYAPNFLAEYAGDLSLAKALNGQGLNNVYVGATLDEGKRMHRALVAEEIVSKNWDAATNSWLPLTGCDLQGAVVVCASYQKLFTTREVPHPPCFDNLLQAAEAGARVVVVTWKTEEFIRKQGIALKEMFGKLPSSFNKFSFVKGGKGHTSHFYVIASQVEGPAASFYTFILSAMAQVTRVAYALEKFVAAGCEHGVKPVLTSATAGISKQITELVRGTARPLNLERHASFRLNASTVTVVFDPKSAGPMSEQIAELDADDDYQEDEEDEDPEEKDEDQEEDGDQSEDDDESTDEPSIEEKIQAVALAAIAEDKITKPIDLPPLLPARPKITTGGGPKANALTALERLQATYEAKKTVPTVSKNLIDFTDSETSMPATPPVVPIPVKTSSRSTDPPPPPPSATKPTIPPLTGSLPKASAPPRKGAPVGKKKNQQPHVHFKAVDPKFNFRPENN